MSATRRVIQLTDLYRDSYSLYQSLVDEEGGGHDLLLLDPDFARECSVGELEVLNASISEEISRLKYLRCYTERIVQIGHDSCEELPAVHIVKDFSKSKLRRLVSIADSIIRQRIEESSTQKVFQCSLSQPQEECLEQPPQKKGTKRKEYPNEDDFEWVNVMASNVDNAIKQEVSRVVVY